MSLREPAVLQQLREQTQKMSMSQMQISPEQGQLMGLLIELIQAKKTIDIGVFTGYSALAAALALPPQGKVVGCDINGEWTKIARRFWDLAGVADKIDLQLAPAEQTLSSLIDKGEAGTFDFVFIDADKANYDKYYELSLTLLRQGGLIAVDNVLWSGKVADARETDRDTAAIRELNKKVIKRSAYYIEYAANRGWFNFGKETVMEGEILCENGIAVKLINIVNEMLIDIRGIYRQKNITLDLSLQKHLGFDSISLAELFSRIEKTFNIQLPHRFFTESNTLADIANLICAGKTKERTFLTINQNRLFFNLQPIKINLILTQFIH